MNKIEINIYLTAKIQDDDVNNIFASRVHYSGCTYHPLTLLSIVGARRWCGKGCHYFSPCAHPLRQAQLGPGIPFHCGETPSD